MLNRLWVFVLIVLFISSCDKEKYATKKINGTWGITSYKRTETNGLSFYATVSGEMVFSAVNHYNSPSTFTSSINYSFDTDKLQVQILIYNWSFSIQTIEFT